MSLRSDTHLSEPGHGEAAAERSLAPHPRQAETRTRDEPEQVALALPPGPPGGAAFLLADGCWWRRAAARGQHGGRVEGERGAGAFGELVVDLAAGQVRKVQPLL